MTLTKKYLADCAERIVASGVEAFAGAIVLGGAINLSVPHSAELAGLVAAAAAVKAVAASFLGQQGTASVLPASLTPTRTVTRTVERTVIPLTKEQKESEVAKVRPPHVPSPGNIPPGPVSVTKPADHTPKKAAKKK